MNTLNISLKSFQELVKFREQLTGSRKPTKHPFLHKGIGCYGKYRAFITGNGKLLLHFGGKLHTFSFWNDAKWRNAVGRDSDESWKNINLILGRAAYVRGGKQALKNGGWLQKRLFLGGCFGRSWKVIALASTFIPHIMDDARNCPIIARARIRAFVSGDGNLAFMNEMTKDLSWLGGVKVPFVPVVRPEGLAFKPQHRRDIYYIQAIHNAYHIPSAKRWLLANQHRRHEIKGINRDFGWVVADAFRIKENLEEAGRSFHAMKGLDVVTWSNEIHKYWDEHQEEIIRLRQERYNHRPTPGANLIPELEEYRLKTRGEIVQAGKDCRHCVGLYADHQDVVHYRKGNVVAQIQISSQKEWDGAVEDWVDGPTKVYINQCFDFANQVTKASLEFRAEIEKHLARIKPGEFEHRMSYWEEQMAQRLNEEPNIEQGMPAVDDEEIFVFPLPRMVVEEFPF